MKELTITKTILSLFTLFTLLTLYTLKVNGQIIHVPADQPTIQAGIDVATGGDTVLVADGNYIENINYWGKAITVASHFLMDEDTNHINNTIINGSQPANPDYGSVVTFIAAEDTSSVLCGFTITGGTGTYFPIDDFRAGGGIVCYYATATIVHNRIINNECLSDNEANGGGIYCWNESEGNRIIIENNLIGGNSCHGTNKAAGGGMAISSSARIANNVIENCFVKGENEVAMGGGVYAQSIGDEHDTVLICNNTIQNNIATSISANARGGGINSRENFVIIRDNLIKHDSLSGDMTYGAGISVGNTSYLEITGNVITSNIVNKITGYWGVGMFCKEPEGLVKITNNEFLYNQGEHTSTGAGGGLAISDAFDYPVAVDGNLFIQNSAYHGGGFFERSSYNLKLTNNLFIGDSAYRAGAIGMFHNNEQGNEFHPQIINNTFTLNNASNDGGTIRFAGGQKGTPVIMNNIFWENSAPVGEGKDIKNNTSDTLFVYYCDIDETEIVGPWTGDRNINEDPLFINPEIGDFHLDIASPCICQAADSININGTSYYCPLVDFDGNTRPSPQSGVLLKPDIGALEELTVECNPNVYLESSNFRTSIEIYPNPLI